MRIPAVLIIATALLVSPVYAGSSSDDDVASRAATSMAAARVCNADLPQDVKQSLYAKILKFWDTPTMVNHVIAKEVDELRGMNQSDRDAMCQAIKSTLRN